MAGRKTPERQGNSATAGAEITPKHSTNSGDDTPGRLAGLNLAVEPRAVDALIPYAKNARTHSDGQVTEIAASIRAFGWTNRSWWMARTASSPGLEGCSQHES
jgi:hypothetical protein